MSSPSRVQRQALPLSKSDEARARLAVITPPGRFEDLVPLRALLAQALASIDELREERLEHHRDRNAACRVAWAEAVRLGRLRDSLAARGRDASVRAVAREAGTSDGRAGDLLKAFDAFPELALLAIGEEHGEEYTPERFATAPKRGARILSQLSFRSLRAVSRIPRFFDRVREVRRLTADRAFDRVARPDNTTR